MSGVVAVPSPAPAGISARLHEPLTLKVFESLAAAEASWRAMERDAFSSPYQRFDWVETFASSVTPRTEIRVLAILDGAGRPLLLMPFALEKRAGLRIAEGVGGKHANFNLPVLASAAAAKLLEPEIERLMREAAMRIGIDAFVLSSVPRSWAGQPDPLAPLGTPSPSDAYEVRLEADPEATAHRSMSNEARKRLRNKERGLAKLGEVSFLQARDEREVDFLLDAFFDQKEGRFRELGIADPFAEPGVRDFIRKGALRGLSEGRAAIELYGLLVGGRVAAVLGGAADARRLSGMFISFEAAPDVTKYSPGDILVSRIIREQCVRGREFFDLGVGEARYKRTFCNDTVELVDIFLPTSLRGKLYALAGRGAAGIKRRVKQNPRAMQLVARLRRAAAA